MSDNVYPIMTIPVPSQRILDAGPTIFSPFNPVLTVEVNMIVDRPDDVNDEAPAIDQKMSYSEPRIPFGLTAYGTYFATLGNVFDLATRFQDHLNPTVLDTLRHREVAIDPTEPESETVLLAANSPALAVSLERISLPFDWSATVCLHPHLTALGVSANSVTLPPSFNGHIRLPIFNLNPKLPLRLFRGHGFFALTFQQHHMSVDRIPIPDMTTDELNAMLDAARHDSRENRDH